MKQYKTVQKFITHIMSCQLADLEAWAVTGVTWQGLKAAAK